VLVPIEHSPHSRSLSSLGGQDLLDTANLSIISFTGDNLAVNASANANVRGNAGCTLGVNCSMAVVDGL
jgi:hypothetical protein